jgi:predicted transposase/invertase (TIGR01784 family)
MKTSNGRLNPLNDYLFLKVMGEKGDEVQLLGFLNAVLGKTGEDQFVSVEILENKTFSAETIGDKTSILDVRAMLQDGTMVNIEVQLRNQENMDRRSLYYWSREFTKGLSAGLDYDKLPNAISINIINFRLFKTKSFHTVFHMREDSDPSLVLTDALEIHFLDMVKYRKLKNKDVLNDPLYRWLTWLDETSPPELIEKVVGMDEAIKAADERMVYVTGDADAIRAYEMRQMALADETARMRYVQKKGMAKGMTKGRKEEKLEIARKMKAMGLSADQIQTITGLSPGAY